MVNFAVWLIHDPRWDSTRRIRKQDGRNESTPPSMDGLVDEGFLILGAPDGDSDETTHAIETLSLRTLQAADP